MTTKTTTCLVCGWDDCTDCLNGIALGGAMGDVAPMSLETQATIMIDHAEAHLTGSDGFDKDDYDAALILNRLSSEIYYGGSWTFGEPLY